MKKWIVSMLILFLHISPVQAQEISTSLTVMHHEEDTCQYTLSGDEHKVIPYRLPLPMLAVIRIR